MTFAWMRLPFLHSEYGENWTKNYPSPVKQLAEKDGLTYYLAYVSDVQYDPANQEIAAKYKEMFTAAQNITADDFVLDDLTDKDGTVRRAQLLTSLGAHYAVLHMGAQHDQPYQVALIRIIIPVRSMSAVSTGQPKHSIRSMPLIG